MTGTWNGRERELFDMIPKPWEAERLDRVLTVVSHCIHQIDKAEDGDIRREDVEFGVYEALKGMADELWGDE